MRARNLIILVSLLACSTCQKLTVINVKTYPYFLSTTDTEYRSKEQLDLIWNISKKAEIRFSSFDIDNQSGEFLVVCEYPLVDSDEFGDGAPAEDVVGKLPLEKSWLLTYDPLDVDAEGDEKHLVVRIRNDDGGFLYFHGVESDNTTYSGFEATIEILEDPDPITTTTTERLTTPAPGVDIFLVKHVIGQTPTQFIDNLGKFREMLVNMSNLYCNDTSDIQLPEYAEVELKDVRLDNTSIYFCDHKLAEYEKCVMINLAITTRDANGYYIFNTTQLTDMWNKLGEPALKGLSLQTFEPEPEKAPVSWIWIASSLGVVLILVLLLCFTFTAGEFTKKGGSGSGEPMNFVRRPSRTSDLTDPEHPIIKLVQTYFSKPTHDEAEVMGMNDHLRHFQADSRTESSGNGSSPFRNKKSNPLNNSSHVNQGYEGTPDDHRGYLHVPASSSTYGYGRSINGPVASYDDSDSDDVVELNIKPGVFYD